MSASGSAILVLWIAVNKQNLRLHASPVSRERVNGRALSAVIETRTLSRAVLICRFTLQALYNALQKLSRSKEKLCNALQGFCSALQSFYNALQSFYDALQKLCSAR